MLAFFKKNIVLIIILILIVLASAWYLQSRSAETPDDVTVTVNEQTVDAIGGDILTALNQLNTLKLDGSLFQNRTFLKLIDFSRPVERQVVGRPNPFAPLGSSAARSTATTTAR